MTPWQATGVSSRPCVVGDGLSSLAGASFSNCAPELRGDDQFCSRCGTAVDVDQLVADGPRIEFERFFELAVDVFVVTGPDGRFEMVNPALSRLLGVEREVILAKPWSEFVHPDDRERSAEENAREFAQGHRTVTFENRYVDAAGGIHWMDWNAELDPATGVVYGIARDVTEQRAARVALEEARTAADNARQAAEAANRAKSEFLSRMSHELRTPLNAVLGFGQMLQLDALDQRQGEYVEQILRGGRHLLELIDEVLDISKIEIGAVAISVEPVSVSDIAAESVRLLEPLAKARQITLRSAIADDPDWHVMADQQRLRQVLVNYLSNAIKYTPPGSTATISAEPVTDGWLRVAVSDDGPGIAPRLIARLFQPFERIGAEQAGIEGTGLGLAHSKALVERMGGQVGVESTVGVGSRFWLKLRTVEPAAGLPGASEHVSVADSTATVGSLLYIEDNPSNLRLVERALELRPGITFLSAMLGRVGLDLAREHRPDLIVLDLNLPDIGGDRVLAELRADSATAAIPVVILSADATRRQRERLLALGARAYLTKPLDVRSFLASVDDFFGPASDPRSD
jgi:PAS domain S-box-containing protein